MVDDDKDIITFHDVDGWYEAICNLPHSEFLYENPDRRKSIRFLVQFGRVSNSSHDNHFGERFENLLYRLTMEQHYTVERLDIDDR